ncbi:hypothetical protein D9598_07660 [Roseomonas sp. KE0001]|nr:hypothetical protein [Roseomonas sp. KE0001]
MARMSLTQKTASGRRAGARAARAVPAAKPAAWLAPRGRYARPGTLQDLAGMNTLMGFEEVRDFDRRWARPASGTTE